MPNPDDTIGGDVPQPSMLAFDMAEIEGFRYRVSDIRRGVTKAAVQEVCVVYISVCVHVCMYVIHIYEMRPLVI